MPIQVGERISGRSDARLVVTYDTDKLDLAPVILPAKRLDDVTAYFVENKSRLFPEGSIPQGAAVHDADEALIFAVGALTYTEQTVRQRYYKLMQYTQLVDISTEIGPWAEQFRFEREDGVGRMQWLPPDASTIPFVEVASDQASQDIAHGMIGVRWSLQEIRAAAYYRRPLTQRRMEWAQKAIEREFNTAFRSGVKAKNLPGFFNHPSISQIAVGGTGGTLYNGKWNTETDSAKILADVNRLLLAVFTNTGYNEAPTDLGVPAEVFSYWSTTPRSTYSDITILDYLLAHNIANNMFAEAASAAGGATPQKLRIHPVYGLETAGAATTGGAISGSNSRTIVWVKRPDCLAFHIPMKGLWGSPQIDNTVYKQIAESRCGGVEVGQPTTALYLDKVMHNGSAAY